MAELKVTKIVRHSLGENVRVLVVAVGGDESRTLSTRITKISLPEVFMKQAGKNAPVEQYAFKVGEKVVARFADAAALVLKKHHVKFESEEGLPQYLKKAVAIAAGREALQMAEEKFVSQ